MLETNAEDNGAFGDFGSTLGGGSGLEYAEAGPGEGEISPPRVRWSWNMKDGR